MGFTGCSYLSMLGLKLIHVNKRVLRCRIIWISSVPREGSTNKIKRVAQLYYLQCPEMFEMTLAIQRNGITCKSCRQSFPLPGLTKHKVSQCGTEPLALITVYNNFYMLWKYIILILQQYFYVNKSTYDTSIIAKQYMIQKWDLMSHTNFITLTWCQTHDLWFSFKEFCWLGLIALLWVQW